MGYISKQGLENLPRYKSSETVDNSILYYSIISPVCNILVNKLPLWLAPNLITVLGAGTNVVGFLLGICLIGIGKDDSSLLRIVSLFGGLAIFTNMTLDNMDGKQARRTKTSSPLGELVDHGCDSLGILLGAVMTGIITGATPGPILLFFALCSATFYLAHWEEYFTHSLTLGAIGPVETQVILTFFHVLTYFVGRPWWLNVITIGDYSMNYMQMVMVALLVGSTYTSVTSIVSGLSKAKKRNISILYALSQLVPITICYISGAVWVYANYAFFVEHCIMFVTIFGLLFSFLVIRCIVERICNEPFRLFYKIMTPLLLATLNASFHYFEREPLLPEKVVLWGVFVTLLGGWFHLAINILNDFCGQLHISAFTIPYPQKKLL